MSGFEPMSSGNLLPPNQSVCQGRFGDLGKKRIGSNFLGRKKWFRCVKFNLFSAESGSSAMTRTFPELRSNETI